MGWFVFGAESVKLMEVFTQGQDRQGKRGRCSEVRRSERTGAGRKMRGMGGNECVKLRSKRTWSLSSDSPPPPHTYTHT